MMSLFVDFNFKFYFLFIAFYSYFIDSIVFKFPFFESTFIRAN